MTITGTNHFVDMKSALKYYCPYGFSVYDIEMKVFLGEISLGEPELKPGQKLLVIDNGTRYAIEE